jgi:hypothetical protein
MPDPPSSLNADVPPELEAIVRHAIEKDKNRRFQSMQEMEAALRDPGAHLANYRQLPGYTPPRASQSNPGTMVLGASAPTVRGPSGILQSVAPPSASGPRPTTLSGAASEVTNVAAPPSRTPVIATLAAVLTLGLAGGGWFLLRPKADATPAAQPPPAVVEAQAPKDEMVTITITSEPAGAHVIRADQGGADVGATPVEIKAKKGDPAFDVQIRKEGFKSQTRSVSTSSSKEIQVDLAKVEAALPPPTAPPPAAPPPVTKVTKAPPAHHTTGAPPKKSGKKDRDADDIMTPSF